MPYEESIYLTKPWCFGSMKACDKIIDLYMCQGKVLWSWGPATKI